MFAPSIRLFSLFGFDVKVDASWLLLAVLIVWSLAAGYFPSVAPGLEPATYWSMGVIGLIGLAFSIVVHELAHSLVARRYDMPIRGITLFVFGGVAEMEKEPTSAKGEFLMAIAGPAMSVAVAIGFGLLASLAGGLAATGGGGGDGGVPPVAIVLSYLAAINGLLALFNMLPAFPLDGGRMLRAALWGWRGDIVWATRVAAGAGSAFAFALMALGLVNLVSGNAIGGVWYFVLGLFIRAAAAGQIQHQTTRSVLSGASVDRFMRAEPVAVAPELPLERLIGDYFYRYYFKSFPVVADERLIGVVSVADVKHALEADGEAASDRTVREVMEDPGEDGIVAPDGDAADALDRMRRRGAGHLYVVDRTRLVGVVTLRDLLNYLSIRVDLDEAGRHPPATPKHAA
ncbi:MAG: site-2 protease family protein [Azospirillaceae bacterium]